MQAFQFNNEDQNANEIGRYKRRSQSESASNRVKNQQLMVRINAQDRRSRSMDTKRSTPGIYF